MIFLINIKFSRFFPLCSMSRSYTAISLLVSTKIKRKDLTQGKEDTRTILPCAQWKIGWWFYRVLQWYAQEITTSL